jgi:ATP-dependent exoDNAse (exonuclease V) beta subunit
VSLTRAIGAPTDRIAWSAVLRAPWCGLTLADLTLLCAGARRATLPELWADAARRGSLSEDGSRRLERVRPLLDAALAATTVPIALRVESTWLQLGGAGAYADAGAVEDARRYLETLAAETDHATRIDPLELAALLEGLYAGSDSSAVGAVQVMTIHRAKGLEFDVVVLPGLERRLRGDDSGLLEWLAWEEDDGAPRLLFAPTAGVRRDDDEEPRGSVRKVLRSVRSARRLRERARLLYVAMTRARSALHLFGTLKEDEGGGARAPAPQSALGVLWDALGAEFSARWLEDDGTGAPAATAPTGLTRLRLGLPEPVWPTDLAFERLSLPSAELVAAPELAWGSDMARLAGTVVHRELERLARAEVLPEPSAIGSDLPRLRALLQAEGVAQHEMDEALRRVADALRATLGDPRGRWMLSRHPVDDLVEHELTGLHEGRIENIVIDRSFVDAEGTRWVIDYKTSWHEGGDLEGFIASRREHYAPQLRKYKAFAARLGPQPVRTALYFPLLGGRFEEYDPG